MALVIVRAKAGQRSLKAQMGAPRKITVTARSEGLVAGRVVIETK